MSITFHGGGDESVFVVETITKAGTMLQSHQHAHSHLSVLASGTADVTVDGKTERITGYKMISIPANTNHKVVAVTDIIWLCLWADDIAPRELAENSLKLVDV